MACVVLHGSPEDDSLILSSTLFLFIYSPPAVTVATQTKYYKRNKTANQKKTNEKNQGTHLIPAGVEEISETYNVAVVQLPHDLQLTILHWWGKKKQKL